MEATSGAAGHPDYFWVTRVIVGSLLLLWGCGGCVLL